MAKNTEEDSVQLSGKKLKSYIAKIENLEEQKSHITADINDVYGEVKSNGFDAKVLKNVIKLRKLSKERRTEEQELLDLYMSAIGME